MKKGRRITNYSYESSHRSVFNVRIETPAPEDASAIEKPLCMRVIATFWWMSTCKNPGFINVGRVRAVEEGYTEEGSQISILNHLILFNVRILDR